MQGWRVALWGLIVLATLGFFYLVRGILLPFVLAVVISIVLDPSIRKLRMRGMSRGMAVLTVTLGFVVVFTAIAVWLTPMVGTQLGAFRTTVEKVSSGIAAPDPNQNFFVRWNPVVIVEAPRQQDFVDKALQDFEPQLKMAGLPTTRKGLYDRYVAPNSKQIAQGVQNFFNSFFGMVGAFTSQLFFLIFTPLLVFMILIDLDRLKKRSVAFIPPAIRVSTVDLLSDIGNVFTNYLRGISLTVLVYMGLASAILLLFGMPYSILLGMLLGLVYLIPYIRVFIWVPLLLAVGSFSGKERLLFIELPSPLHYAAIVTLIYFAFDISFDTFVTPRIIGKAVGLNPVVSMFVSFAGGALFGIPGMLLAYPSAGAVKVVLDRLLRITSSTSENLSLPAVPLRHRA